MLYGTQLVWYFFRRTPVLRPPKHRIRPARATQLQTTSRLRKERSSCAFKVLHLRGFPFDLVKTTHIATSSAKVVDGHHKSVRKIQALSRTHIRTSTRVGFEWLAENTCLRNFDLVSLPKSGAGLALTTNRCKAYVDEFRVLREVTLNTKPSNGYAGGT